MKVIIAVSRNIKSHVIVNKAILESGFAISQVVSGHAPGVDRIGEAIAKESGLSVKLFPTDWTSFGKSAGPIRNEQMAKYADALIAVWDGESKGTLHMIGTAREEGLKVYVYNAKHHRE